MNALLKFLRPSRRWLAAALSCLTLAALLESVGLSLFVPLIMTAMADGSPSLGPGGSAWFSSYIRFLDGLSGHHGRGLIVTALCLALILKNLFGYAGRLLGASVELRTVSSLRLQLFDSYLGSNYQFFLDRKHGRLVHDLFNETAMVGEMIAVGIVVFSHVITIAALYLLLLLISWKATLVASTTFVLLTVGLQYLSQLAKRMGALRQRLARELVAFSTDLIAGIRQIKVFAAEPLFVARFRQSTDQLSRMNLRLRAISLSVEPLSELVVLLVMVSLVLLATQGLAGAAAAQVSVLVTSAVVLVRLLPIVGGLNRELIRIATRRKSLEIVADLLARAPQRPAGPPRRAFSALRDTIAFEGVDFSYPGTAQTPVLRHITLAIPKGRVIAVVGPSGSGKSTLIDLVARLYDPCRGRLVMDGVDVREYELGSWRRAIGFVSQDTFLFNASIRENIALASPTASDADIRWAAEQADADEFIRQLPQGYDTVVGERGLKLSGGQRQRLAIARAILHHPTILMFDEATSSLDQESEQRVHRAIERISHDRTVIMVAHRLSTISRADQIIVLDRGRIVEQGTHEELMGRCGLYWSLYRADGTPRPSQMGVAVIGEG